MKTNYQKVLALFSGTARSRYTIGEMMQIIDDFLMETKEAFDSGLEVRQIAAIEKLKNIKQLIDELQEERLLIADESEMDPITHEHFMEIKSDIQKRFERVMKAYRQSQENQ